METDIKFMDQEKFNELMNGMYASFARGRERERKRVNKKREDLPC